MSQHPVREPWLRCGTAMVKVIWPDATEKQVDDVMYVSVMEAACGTSVLPPEIENTTSDTPDCRFMLTVAQTAQQAMLKHKLGTLLPDFHEVAATV